MFIILGAVFISLSLYCSFFYAENLFLLSLIVIMKQITDITVFPSLDFITRRLSLKHEQVNERRIIDKTNEVVSNILAVGRMKKMNLIAINNRSISIYGKVKRA